MTAISDHCTVINDWLNFEYSEALVTSWTRMAEQYLSTIVRSKHMIAIDVANVSSSRVALPSDWLVLDFVRVVDGIPLKFRTREEFYSNPTNDPNRNEGFYTLTGNYLMVGGNVADGKQVELSYYEEIPPLADDPNWLMERYTGLYITATLSAGAAYSIEDSRIPQWQTATDRFANQITAEHMASKTSGSILVKPRSKGFG